jgi:hypothetical protein
MTTWASIGYPKFESNFCNEITSHAVIAMPLYFASMLDSAAIGCFLLLQLIAPLQKKNMKPLVDFLYEKIQAQLTSVYPCTCN